MVKSEKSEGESKNANEVGRLTIISRVSWGAMPAKFKVPLDNPVNEIEYTDTDTLSCSTKQECTQIVKGLQKYHMELKGLPDIEPNFLIGGDGNVYEGRGWQTSVENDSTGSKPISKETRLEVAFIGSFKEGDIPNEMKDVAEGLITYGIENKLIGAAEEGNEPDEESDGGKNTKEEIKNKQ